MFRVALSLVCLALVGVHCEEDSDRIVGGKAITIQECPHQVSIQQWKQHFCGGSLITPIFVLTAAHCCSDIHDGNSDIKDISVRAGSSNWRIGGVSRQVILVVSHPGYIQKTMDNDVAMMKVESPFPMSGAISTIPICKSLPADGSKLYVSGWGRMDENAKTLPDILQGVVLSKLSRGACQAYPFRYGAGILASMFCANGKGTDSCQGDSGGPLILNDHTCQCGVVSYGIGCAQPDYPGVYCDLTNPGVRSFIRSYVPNVV